MHATVIVPVYNEETNIPIMAAELATVRQTVADLDVLFVDDGSTDATWSAIQTAAAEHPFVRGLPSPANAGQTAAMLRGMRAVTSEAIVLMDGDLQNDPADIPALLSQLDGVDVVCGYRANRKDSWSRRVGSRLANRVRNWVTHDGIRDTGCSLKAFRREVVADIPPLNGAHRFLPAYFSLHGRRLVEVAVNHRPRLHGISKYTNLKRLPGTIADLFGFWWYRRRLLKLADHDPIQP
ncbi:MAG: glycosyltransferase family 2 protein [Verrucomicrobia bacterium]|nr:glycosyltransferase family 2 protein [Verrucomicrobiota bacterium]